MQQPYIAAVNGNGKKTERGGHGQRAWPIFRVNLISRTARGGTRFDMHPLHTTGWECMSKRTANFDMQRISAAMNGRTCRKGDIAP